MNGQVGLHGITNPLTFTVLRLLVDGKFHSGEILAQRLGVSRASVNNALREVDQLGLVLYSVRGKGYCLPNPPQWLSADIVRHNLRQQTGEKIAASMQIEICDNLPSTNTLLLQRAMQGASSGSVIAAEWQDSGRGRLGRKWYSGLGNALTFSLLWRFECGLSGLSGLSLAIGVALVRVLHKCGAYGAQLKWPNDILSKPNDGLSKTAKLGGVLLEAQGDMLGPSAVVIGIGLNITAPKIFLTQIEQPVIGLADLVEHVPERNFLLAALLAELEEVLQQFATQGFVAFHKEWEKYHALQGQKVTLAMPDGSRVKGIARGVTDDGALILETMRGMQIINAGEINTGEINSSKDNSRNADAGTINPAPANKHTIKTSRQIKTNGL
ncbi:MAG: biotin--[acetyl-CoA-carboxylase] ligase [Candidatus Nitrotoga sp.]